MILTEQLVKEYRDENTSVKRHNEIKEIIGDRISEVVRVICVNNNGWYFANSMGEDDDGRIEEEDLRINGSINVIVYYKDHEASSLEFPSKYLYMTDEEITKDLAKIEQKKQDDRLKAKQDRQDKKATKELAKKSGLEKIKLLLTKEELTALGIRKTISPEEYKSVVKV
jgi:hypothetical protein